MGALTDPDAVTAQLLRPLTDFENGQFPELLQQAENALRTRLPSLDARLAAFTANSTDPVGIDPQAVRRVLAGVIVRKLTNPAGAASTSSSRTDGPFSTSSSIAYASYGRFIGDGTPGALEITDADVAALLARASGLPRTIKLNPDAALPCESARADWAET